MNKLTVTFALTLYTLPFLATASDNSCEIEGYTIGFFNGVATTRDEARNGRKKLESTLGRTQYNSESGDYQLFYNDSNIEEAMINLLGDFAETFDQRTQELEQKDFDRWEAFWDIVNGRNDSPIIQKIDSLLSGFIDFVMDSISLTFNNKIKNFLERLATLSGSTPNTEDVRMKHRLINDAQTWKGKKLIYIAHSQGNLWMNESYDYVLSQKGYDSSNIKVIHIAPASPTVNGDYILSGNDLVINGLQFTGIGSVKPFNFTAPVSKNDRAGHGLVEIYLSDTKAKEMLRTSVNNAFSSIQKPDMDDYLFEITYAYTPTFIGSHTRPDIAIVDNNDDWMIRADIYSPDSYLKEVALHEYILTTARGFEPLSFNHDRSDRAYQVFTIDQCDEISSEKPYVIGEYSKETVNLAPMWPDLPTNIRTSVSIRDRYGWLLHKDSVSYNEYRDSGWLYIGSFIDFRVTNPYTEKEKHYLNQNGLSGKYELFSDYIFFAFQS